MDYALIFQPVYDEATELQALYLRQLEPYLKQIYPRSIFVYGNLKEADFEYYLAKYNPKFIYFGGHGYKDGILGSNEYIIRFGYNDYLLKGKGVYLFECDSADTLGKFTYARAVLGYVKPYYLYTEPTFYLGFYPLQLALQRYTFGDIYKYTLEQYTIEIKRHLHSSDILEHNMKAFRLFGDMYFKL